MAKALKSGKYPYGLNITSSHNFINPKNGDCTFNSRATAVFRMIEGLNSYIAKHNIIHLDKIIESLKYSSN